MRELKIRKVVIHNYRSIRHVRIDLRDWIGFIGENNVGKTNILMALRLFFSPTARGLSEDDFFKGKAQGEENAIRISVEFHQVTDRERKKFRKYLIDNRLTV
ncbi:MAG: AAA family ATPase [Thermoplasmata archaeon]